MAVPRQVGGLQPRAHALVLEVGERDLEALTKRKGRIALAKANGGSEPNAVWLAWKPTGVSTVTWLETYGVYAGPIPERRGAPIDIIAWVQPAVERAVHSFLGQTFASPVGVCDLPRSHYQILNGSPSPAAFGLLQAAAINQVAVVAPLNAVVLPPGFIAEFASFDVTYVWVQADIRGATVMPSLPNVATTIVRTGRERSNRYHYRYDAATSLFLPVPCTQPNTHDPADAGAPPPEA